MPMTDRAPASSVARGARLLAWLALPVAALVVLRLFDPLALGSDPSAAPAWLVPAACALGAIVGAVAALVALSDALRGDGSVPRLLDAAGAGALAASMGTVALQGPAASPDAPQAVIGLGLLAAAVPFVVGGLMGPLGFRDRWARTAALVGVFTWVEAAPVVGLLAGTSLAPGTAAIAAAGAGLGLVAAVSALASGSIDRIGWIAGLASGAAALAAARVGSADVLPGLLALTAGMVGMIVWLVASAVREDAEPLGPPAGAAPLEPAPAPEPASELESQVDSLARELRATIAELLGARETITLQRAELERLADTDPATRVSTRRAILARLEAEAAEARRYSHPIALVLVDLDGLTELNRSHGIGVGDVVLAELALRLRTRMREADAIGRITGDTFLAILPHTDERGASVFADAIRTRLTTRPVQTNAGPVTMTVSIGITVAQPGISDGDDDELIGRAEEALNSARAAGGSRIAFDRSHGLARLDERRPDERGPDQPGTRRPGEARRPPGDEGERPA